MVDFAILAAVPLEHLRSGLDVCRDRGHVTLQSHKRELFRDVERRRGRDLVPVLLYPSRDPERRRSSFRVTWTAMCFGSTDDLRAKRREERGGHRPPTTRRYPEDRSDRVAVFWFVKNLRRLPEAEQVPIGRLSSYRTSRRRRSSAPRGPELVRRPDWI
ncbi:MAG TPA: hypothetical protein VIC56_03205 [Gemmatimonadota bacterium]